MFGFMRWWAILLGIALVVLIGAIEWWHARRLSAFAFPKVNAEWRREKRLESALLMAVAMLLGAAMAGPYVRAPIPSRGLCVIFTLDVSRSMLATDYTQTSRFDRAKLAVRELVRNFPNGRGGYIVFAGDAMVRKIRTSDLTSLADDIAEEEIESTDKTGTNLASAIEAAVNLAKNYYVSVDKASDRCVPTVVFLSDGGHEWTPLEVAPALADLRALGVKVISMGFGTAEGADVQIGDEFYRTVLNETALKDMASSTGGEYRRIVTGKELAETFLTRPDLTVPLPPKTSNRELFQIPLVLAGIALTRFLAGRNPFSS